MRVGVGGLCAYATLCLIFSRCSIKTLFAFELAFSIAFCYILNIDIIVYIFQVSLIQFHILFSKDWGLRDYIFGKVIPHIENGIDNIVSSQYLFYCKTSNFFLMGHICRDSME